MMYALYQLLRDLLQRKPPASLRHTTADNSSASVIRLSVQTVRLSFASVKSHESVPDTAEAKLRAWRHDTGREPILYPMDAAVVVPNTYYKVFTGYAPFPTSPRWLADLTWFWLRTILCMGRYTATCGSVVHEQVGKFAFCVDGSPIAELDPGQTLSHLEVRAEETREPTAPVGMVRDRSFWTTRTRDDRRRMTFWCWKYRAVRHRRALGLSIPDQIVWPTLEEITRWRRVAEVRKEERASFLAEINSGLSEAALAIAIAEPEDEEGTSCFTGECLMEGCMCSDRSLDEMLRREAGLSDPVDDALASTFRYNSSGRKQKASPSYPTQRPSKHVSRECSRPEAEAQSSKSDKTSFQAQLEQFFGPGTEAQSLTSDTESIP